MSRWLSIWMFVIFAGLVIYQDRLSEMRTANGGGAARAVQFSMSAESFEGEI